MPMDPAYLALMPDTVTIEPFVHADEYGDTNYGPPVVVRARVQESLVEVRTDAGTVRSPMTIVYPFDYLGNLTARDRVTLPDGLQPAIVSVVGERDGKGLHHFEVYCERVAPRNA